jgi:hypothetical protein
MIAEARVLRASTAAVLLRLTPVRAKAKVRERAKGKAREKAKGKAREKAKGCITARATVRTSSTTTSTA